MGQSTLAMADVSSLARTGCGAHAEIKSWLAKRFDESPVLRGLQSDGHLLEVFAARNGKTWTMLVTAPDGTSCIVQDGIALDTLDFRLTGTGPLT
jgi:hypothetical protein